MLLQPALRWIRTASTLAVAILALAALWIVTSDQAGAAQADYDEIDVSLGQPMTIMEDPEQGLFNSSTSRDAEFDLIGILWDGDQVDEVWVRIRDSGRKWSDWTELGIHPDEDSPQNGSDPVWAENSTGFQVAVDGNPQNFRVGLVSDSTPVQASLASALAASGPSFVHSRSEWDAGGDCRPAGESVGYSDVQGIVVHHTVSGASSPSDVPRAIDAICNFHVQGRGWSDIGYNAVVDRYGGVWEGRTGGLEAGISGAHAAGFNSSTQGVAMLGDFSNSAPTTAQQNSLVDLLDWMTGWYFIDPDSTITLFSRSNGPRFDEGEAVTLPSIMGHRDLGRTSCPGDAGYARLPSIRSQVSPTPRSVDSSLGDEIAGYSSYTARFALNDLTPTGAVRHPIAYLNLSSGWTSIEAVELDGDPRDEIHFYNRQTGALVIHNLTSTGALGSVIRLGTLGTGWTTMEPADTEGDGNDELFFYRQSDGRFGFYQIDQNGALGHGIRAGFFGAGWTSVEPVDYNGDGEDEMMFYRKSDGRFSFYHLSPEGFIGEAIRVNNFGQGWDIIEPIDVDGNGDDELLFYRQIDGRYAYYDLGAGGFINGAIRVGHYPNHLVALTSPDLD